MKKPIIFIGGAARSGTTLLRVILDSHPIIACGPEFKISQLIAQQWYDFQTKYFHIFKELYVTHEDINRIFKNFIISFLEKNCIHEKKQRIAEKTPNNINIFLHLHEIFPTSPLIHVIRDGRDVIASLMTMKWKNPLGKPLEYTQDIEKAAQFWVSTVTIGKNFLKSSPTVSNVYYEVRYEDIVRKPEECLSQLFDFIDEPWDPVVLKYYNKDRKLANESSAEQVTQQLYTSSIGRWKNDFSVDDKNKVKRIAGKLLVELGYANDFNW